MERSVDAEDVDGREVEVEFERVGLPAAEELDVVLVEAGHLGRGRSASAPGVACELGGVEAHQRQVLANGLDGLVARERRAVGEGEEGSGGRERCGAVERLKGRNGAGRGAGDGGETDGDPFSEGVCLGRREDDVDGGGALKRRLEGDGGVGALGLPSLSLIGHFLHISLLHSTLNISLIIFMSIVSLPLLASL